MPGTDQLLLLLKELDKKSSEQLKKRIKDIIDDLINNNFNALIELLYRIDIDEKKLKELLKSNNDTDASSIITDLVISRQLQKKETRTKFSNRNKPGNEDGW